MNNIFRAIAMSILFVGSALSITYGVHNYVEDSRTVEEEAFKFACQAGPYSCRGVSMPYVTKTLTMGPYHHGMFFGGNVLFVNWVIEPEKYPYDFATLVHEMTHYLQTEVGGLTPGQGGGRLTCAVEEEAFAVSNSWLELNGHPEEIRTTWATDYRCYVRSFEDEPLDEAEHHVENTTDDSDE